MSPAGPYSAVPHDGVDLAPIGGAVHGAVDQASEERTCGGDGLVVGGAGLRLMAVHAHPDDESSKGAATMARHSRAGVEVPVCTLTGGERADILNKAMYRP